MEVSKSEECPLSNFSNNSTLNLLSLLVLILHQHHSFFPIIILDRSLTLDAHLKKLSASLSSIIHIISVTADASLGWCRFTLKIAFHDLICSKLDYVAPAWPILLSATKLSCLGCLQTILFILSRAILYVTYYKLYVWKPTFRVTVLAATMIIQNVSFSSFVQVINELICQALQSHNHVANVQQMSCYYDHKTKSVYKPPRNLRVACNRNWGCSDVQNEDLGKP